MFKPIIYEGKTKEGEWVSGNLIYSKDADDEFKAIIVPFTDNCIQTEQSNPPFGYYDLLCFEVWHCVDINSIKIINNNLD